MSTFSRATTRNPKDVVPCSRHAKPSTLNPEMQYRNAVHSFNSSSFTSYPPPISSSSIPPQMKPKPKGFCSATHTRSSKSFLYSVGPQQIWLRPDLSKVGFKLGLTSDLSKFGLELPLLGQTSANLVSRRDFGFRISGLRCRVQRLPGAQGACCPWRGRQGPRCHRIGAHPTHPTQMTTSFVRFL